MSQVDSRRVVDELLVASHHTCCICKDARITPQIHHIDNDRTNNDPDNLVPLCPNCHDRVATRYAFTRRYTPAQVKLYRNGWFQLCKQADQKVAGLVVEREETIPTDWVVTYGTNTNEVGSVLPKDAPSAYPELCDWLLKDLETRLQTRIPHVTFLEEYRSGETLSVRFDFKWNPLAEKVDLKRDMAWWQLLELLPYEDLYPEK